jgi:sugar O-acyltransferase (sialic acid O-acetyltransferase NeuD family)
MSRNDVILIGAGGHSRSCIDTIEQEGKYRIVGLVGLKEEVSLSHFGYEIIGSDLDLENLSKKISNALITIGQINTAELRIHLYEQALNLGFKLPSIVAPSAYVSRHAKIGGGTIVMPSAIINSGVEIGDNCIINSRALIEHDSQISDHCHISTGAILNGNTSVGIGSFIGSGTIVKEGISIGAKSLVGMGLTLRHNLNGESIFLGDSLQ